MLPLVLSFMIVALGVVCILIGVHVLSNKNEYVKVNLPTPNKGRGIPGDVLDLTNWSLALPIPNDRNLPLTINQPELNQFSNEFFYATSDNGVAFRAHAGGVTSRNSQYARCEIREMTNSGRTNAAWNSSSGSHTMRVTQAITKVTPKKPHMVSAQIHAYKDAALTVVIKGNKLCVENFGKEIAVLDPQYRLGTKFTIRITVTSGNASVFYNDVQMARLVVKENSCYFKTGAYLASSTEKGDAPESYGEVIVYDVDVSHAS